MRYNPKLWTIGAEHEWADYDRTLPLPKGNENNHKDFTVVNSNGIANDPKDTLYKFGGEINTRPTNTIADQVEVMEDLKHIFRKIPPQINYRCNLHIHIRVPELRDDLESLRRVQAYIHRYMPKLFPIVEPIPPVPDKFFGPYKSTEAYNGAQARYNRRVVSHHTLLPPQRIKDQLAAKTTKAFFEAEVPSDNKMPLWHLQPRAAINLRQLIETDTIEFRHFPGTLSPSELKICLSWCKQFLIYALDNSEIDSLWKWAKESKFPEFAPYDHDLELKYKATAHDGSLKKYQIKENIRQILNGSFAP